MAASTSSSILDLVKTNKTVDSCSMELKILRKKKQLKVNSLVILILVIAFQVIFNGLGFCGLFIAYNGVAHSDYMRPFYYQMGTTAASVVLSIVEALLILAGINLLELQQAKCADPEIDHQEKEDHLVIQVIGEKDLKPLNKHGFVKKATLAHTFILYLGIQGINMFILCFYWGLTFAYNYDAAFSDTKTIYPYIGIKILLGIIAPTILAFSILPLALIIRYITNGHIELHQFLQVVFPGIQYKKYHGISYWVMMNMFYFPIGVSRKQVKKWKDALNQGDPLTINQLELQKIKAISRSNPITWKYWHHACDTALSSCLLYAMVTIAFMVTISYIVDHSFIEQVSRSYCRDLTNYEQYNFKCFDVPDLDYINCTNHPTSTSAKNLMCFYIYRLSSNFTPFEAVIEGLILYYICTRIVIGLFQIVKILNTIYKTTVWSILVIIMSMLIAVLVSLFALTTYTVDKHFDILEIFQFIMLSILILMTGILMSTANLFQVREDTVSGKLETID